MAGFRNGAGAVAGNITVSTRKEAAAVVGSGNLGKIAIFDLGGVCGREAFEVTAAIGLYRGRIVIADSNPAFAWMGSDLERPLVALGLDLADKLEARIIAPQAAAPAKRRGQIPAIGCEGQMIDNVPELTKASRLPAALSVE